MKRPWLIILLPAGLGLLAAALLALGLLSQRVVYLRADLGMLAIGVGMILSGWLLSGWLLLRDRERRWGADARAAQRQGVEERRRFLQRLNHELKNPLTALQAGIANAADLASQAELRPILAGLHAQTARLGRLTTDLQKLAELETRRLELSAVKLDDLLTELIEVAQGHPLAGERQLALSLPRAPWPLPAIQVDADLLFVALYNLLENALKFTAPGATIEVRAFEDGATVAIEVADTGPGIEEAERELVWEELYRGQSGRAVPGSGLGLALARTIVARHRGSVALRSRLGQGTVVAVRLPAP